MEEDEDYLGDLSGADEMDGDDYMGDVPELSNSLDSVGIDNGMDGDM